MTNDREEDDNFGQIIRNTILSFKSQIQVHWHDLQIKALKYQSNRTKYDQNISKTYYSLQLLSSVTKNK